MRHKLYLSALLAAATPKACTASTPSPSDPCVIALDPQVDGVDTSLDICTLPRWSDPSTWGGTVPAAGSDVTITPDQTVVLDRNVEVGDLHVHGILVFDAADLELRAKSILVDGRFQIGSPTAPYQHHAKIVLTGDPDMDHDMMGGRVFGVMAGGAVSIHAVSPSPAWTCLGVSSSPGNTKIDLNTAVDWRQQDRIVIAPTDFYGVNQTEERLLAANASGSTVSLDRGLDAPHWGALQTFGTRSLDERAEVANLERLVVIEGVDDARWSTDGQGAHVMVEPGGTLHLDGVAVHRAGQLGRMGRYPIHWHRLSYDDSGQVLADASDQYIKNSVVRESRNRCITLHATNGVTLSNNVCYDITGHGVFLEDAVERRNVIENNLVIKVRNPPADKALLLHELDSFGGASSGFWITNPDNTLRSNAAADAQGNGFWLAFPPAPLGVSSQIAMRPNRLPFGVFDDNRAHSNNSWGLQLDHVPIDAAGNTTEQLYMPVVGGAADGERLPFTVSGFTTFKHTRGGLWNRALGLTFDDCIAGDNARTQFQGASQQGHIQNSLMVGTSANSATPMPADGPPVGVATYHSEFEITGNTFANFPFVSGMQSGAFSTIDYYTRPVEKGLTHNHDNTFLESDIAWRGNPPPEDLNHTVAGALWDPYGLVGPAGNYWVFDVPFLTQGTQCTGVAPLGQNGVSCQGPYYGVLEFIYDGDTSRQYNDTTEMEFLNANGARWFIRDGNTGNILPNMRHAALLHGGTFTVTFPQRAAPRSLHYRVDNVYTTDDWVVLGAELDGSVSVTGYVTTWLNSQEVRNWAPDDPRRASYVRQLSPAASLSEVVSSAGNELWQDKAHNLVYVKIQGGLAPAPIDPATQDALYNPTRVELYQL